jgi:uncharacterized membrane protein
LSRRFWHEICPLASSPRKFIKFMTPWVRHVSARLFFGLLTAVPIVALLGLLLLAPPDGRERAELLQFVGRFHPLSVHLPIALLILVPVFELAGRSRHFPYLIPSVDFLLAAATCGAIMAAALGWCMARGGGYSGPLVTQHMWGGVSVAAAAWLCWVLRAKSGATGLKRSYAVALIATVGVVSFTGYRGGQLSQGENHLTEFMPAPLGGLLRLAARKDAAANSSKSDPATFYGARIQPVFAGHCVTCHGPNKHKAKLRLDSYEGVMRGGSHGVVIKAGAPKESELFHRITLPQSDDDFMPENKRALPAGDVKLIELWISSGASGTQPVDAIKDVPTSATGQAVAEVNFEEIDLAAVAKQRASLAPIVAQLQQRFPNILDYESRTSADIALSASWMGAKFDDNGLAALAALSERIVIADFSNTAITDRSAGAIAAMRHLRVLRLMHTKITDVTVQSLGTLDQLESLSVFDTAVTSAALPAISRLPKLRRIYAGGTKISVDTSVPQEFKEKLIFDSK